ncbi:MAG: thioredoxin family protein [Pseudomonadota bacterium]
MSKIRQIEIFSAGCPVCQDTIDLVNRLACPSCEISVLDMNGEEVAARAAGLGIRSVPAVAVNGKPANCCAGRGVDENTLRAAGIGRPLA